MDLFLSVESVGTIWSFQLVPWATLIPVAPMGSHTFSDLHGEPLTPFSALLLLNKSCLVQIKLATLFTLCIQHCWLVSLFYRNYTPSTSPSLKHANSPGDALAASILIPNLQGWFKVFQPFLRTLRPWLSGMQLTQKTNLWWKSQMDRNRTKVLLIQHLIHIV